MTDTVACHVGKHGLCSGQGDRFPCTCPCHRKTVMLEPGRWTTQRPDETPSQAMNRLTECGPGNGDDDAPAAVA
jgi:hypothetical protein